MIKKYSLVFIAFICFVVSGYGQAILPINTNNLSGSSLPTGFSQSGLGANYSAPCSSSLRIDDAGDSVTLFFTGVPNQLSYRLRANTGSGNWNGTFLIEESPDGATWTILRTFNGSGAIPTSSTTFTDNVLGGSNYIRWTYQNKINGNIAMCNIDLTEIPVTPNVVLDSSNPSIPASNIIQGSDDSPIHAFDLSPTLSNATLTDLDFITSGTYAASNITNFKLWYSSDTTFDSSSDTFLDNITSNLGAGSHTFTGFSQTTNNNATGYFFITTDLPCDATSGNTIAVDATTTSDLTFVSANKSGTADGSGIHTIQTVAPQNATGFNTQDCENESTTVNWTNPAGCFDNVLVFATNTSFTTTTPTGTGVLYTAATSFGGGTAFDGGFCVYKGNGTTEDITNLTNGTNYTFKIFTRKDTSWSSGVNVNCIPTVAYCNAGPTSNIDSEIENVQLTGENNNINNPTYNDCTGGAGGFVNDFTSISADLEIGGNYSLSVEFGDCDGAPQYDGSGGVWIDWNNDGDFDDTNETIGVVNIAMTASDTNVIETFTINVPALQSIGFYRMRIVQEEGATATATPCGTFDWGSVEDYTIEVINSCVASHTISSIAPTSGPIGTEITVTGTGFTNSTSANFAGINALVTFISSTEIIIEVPINASTGTISIFESSCAISSSIFTVLEPSGDCTSSNFTDLFISEVYDAVMGSGNTFYLELYNPTDTDINMEASGSDYEIERYTDFGNATPSETYDLEGIVLANSTYVIRFTSTNPCNTITSFSYDNSGGLGNGINENDRVTLTKNSSDHDTFICPNETGFSFLRDNDATAPSTTYIATDWDEASSLNEDCGDLNMFNPSDDPPIVTGPDDVSACDLTEVVFTVSAIPGNSGSLTYQWYFNDGISSSWLELNSTNFTNATFLGEESNQLTITDGYYNYVGNQFYCLVSEDTSCDVASNAAQLKIPLTVWNSSNWSNGIPNTSTIAIIDDNYTTGQTNQPSFEACSLIINAGNELDVRNGDYVLVQNDVIVNGITTDVNIFELTVQTQGSFVQVADNGTFTSNPGATTRVLKTTSLLNNWYDYTYWSSPVQGETVQDAFPETPADRRYWFDSSNYNDAFYEDSNDNSMQPGAGVDDIDDEGDDWTEASGAFSTMIEGVGYAATYNPNPPPPATYPLIGTATFTGPFNTGDITPEIIINSITGDNDWNLIGNPYPGAIDFIAFHGYSDSTYNNANLIDGCAYLWSHSTPPDGDTNGNQNLNFSQNDYAIITTGSGCLAGGSGVIPDTFIPSGQSFFVKGLSTGDLIFKNAFRDIGNNTQFFGPNNTTQLEVNNSNEPNKIWLNLTSDNGIFNQILVAYVEGATNEFDGFAFDATRNISTGVEAIIYTEIENVALKKFAIQGKAINSLSIDEVIPVGFKTSIESATIYTFSIPQLEGAFLNETPIYIKDNLLGIYHDLKESDYNFTSDVGEFNDRFEIVFNQEQLSLGENELNTNALTIIEHNSGKVEFKVSSKLQIKTIEIIDITGRSVYNFNVTEGASTVYNLSALSQAAYIAKVELTDGRIITRKALKQK